MVKKLTNKILTDMIEEVLREQAEHCEKLPIKDKLECTKADTESRERSADRRRKKEMYGTIPTELTRLSKGIMEEEDTDTDEKITLDREAFDLLMKRLGDEYEAHLENDLSNDLVLDENPDNKKAKIISLCQRYGLRSFKSFLKIINAWELASKGNLLKDKK